MIVTTTPSVEGKSISSYLGTVTGSSIEFTSHSLGGFSSYIVERDARSAVNDAIQNMKSNAPASTEAIIAIEVKTSLAYIGDGAGTLACLATATGTAVKLSNAKVSVEDHYVLPEL